METSVSAHAAVLTVIIHVIKVFKCFNASESYEVAAAIFGILNHITMILHISCFDIYIDRFTVRGQCS